MSAVRGRGAGPRPRTIPSAAAAMPYLDVPPAPPLY